jgi:glycerol-3-phosphate dehydrogenase (NAD(P)+)
VSVPSHGFRSILEAIAALRPGLARLAWATKGFEPRTGRFLDQVARDVLGPGIATAVLSGPSFAREVALGLPTAVTVASTDPAFARDLARRFSNDSFRVYTNDDVVGVQVCGGVKNVLAIAAGIADGLGFGANARAALVTRGLAELSRLGVALGGRPETFMGLAGLGDLILTCTDDQSRNRRFGLALAAGTPAADAQRNLGQVVEGRDNTREVMGLAAGAGVDMPICAQVSRVLFEGLAPRDAVQALMTRQPRSELD